MPRAPLWHESGSAPRSIFCPGRPPGGAGAGAVGCEHTVGQPRRLLCVSAGPGALGDSVETGPGLSLWRGSLVVLFPEMSSAGCPGREVSALHSPTQSQWLSVSRLWVRVGSFSVDAHEVSVPGARGCSGQLAPGCCSGGVSTVCSPGRPCLCVSSRLLLSSSSGQCLSSPAPWAPLHGRWTAAAPSASPACT